MFNSTNFFCPAQPMPQPPVYIPPPQGNYLPNQPRSTSNSKDIVKLCRIINPLNKAFDLFNDDPSIEKAQSLRSKAQTAIEKIEKIYPEQLKNFREPLQKLQNDLDKMEKDNKFSELSIENYRDRPTSLSELVTSTFKSFLGIEDEPPVEQSPTLYPEDDHEKKGIDWLRVDALFSAKKFTEVLEKMFHVIRLEPKNSKAYVIAGRCYHELRQPWHAYSYLTQGITLDPNWPEEVYFRRAMTAMYIGKLVQVEDDLAKAQKQRWNSDPSINEAAYLILLGEVKFYKKEYDQAFALFKKAPMVGKEFVDDRAKIEILSFQAIHSARQKKWSKTQNILKQIEKYSTPLAIQKVFMTHGIIYLESNPLDVQQALIAFSSVHHLGEIGCDVEIIRWFFLNNNPKPAELYFREKAKLTRLSADLLNANILHLVDQASTENLRNFYFAILLELSASEPDSSMESIYESVNCLFEKNLDLTQSIQKFRQGVFRDSKNTPPKLVNAIKSLFDLLEFTVKQPMTLASHFEEKGDALANLFPYDSRDESQNAMIATCYFLSRNPEKSLPFFEAIEKNAHFTWFARFAMHLVNNDIAKRDENFIATETTAYFAELLSLKKSYQRDTLISLMFISGISALIQNSQPEASPVIPTFLLDLMLNQFGLIRNHTPIESDRSGWSSYLALGLVLLTTVAGCIYKCTTLKNRIPLQPTPKAVPASSPSNDKEVMKYIDDSLVALFNYSSSVELKVKKVYNWNGAFEAFIVCENANLWDVLCEQNYLDRYSSAVSCLLGPVEARISEFEDHVPGWVFKFKGSPTPSKNHEKERLKNQVEAIQKIDASVHEKIDCQHMRHVLRQLFDETSSVGLEVIYVEKSKEIFKAKLECSHPKQWPKIRWETNLEGYKKAVETLFDQVSYHIYHDDDSRELLFRFVKSTSETKVLTEALIKMAKEAIQKQDEKVRSQVCKIPKNYH